YLLAIGLQPHRGGKKPIGIGGPGRQAVANHSQHECSNLDSSTCRRSPVISADIQTGENQLEQEEQQAGNLGDVILLSRARLQTLGNEIRSGACENKTEGEPNHQIKDEIKPSEREIDLARTKEVTRGCDRHVGN